MTGSLTSIVLRDEADEPMGYARCSHFSGWLWSCAQCPAANAPGNAGASPLDAVARLVEHIERRHP